MLGDIGFNCAPEYQNQWASIMWEWKIQEYKKRKKLARDQLTCSRQLLCALLCVLHFINVEEKQREVLKDHYNDYRKKNCALNSYLTDKKFGKSYTKCPECSIRCLISVSLISIREVALPSTLSRHWAVLTVKEWNVHGMEIGIW